MVVPLGGSGRRNIKYQIKQMLLPQLSTTRISSTTVLAVPLRLLGKRQFAIRAAICNSVHSSFCRTFYRRLRRQQVEKTRETMYPAPEGDTRHCPACCDLVITSEDQCRPPSTGMNRVTILKCS